MLIASQLYRASKRRLVRYLNIEISYPVNKNVALLKMQNGPVNTLNLEMIRQLTQAVKTVELNDEAKGVCLSSDCKVFSAGFDLKTMYNSPTDTLREYWGAVLDLWGCLYGSRLATVAAIGGHAIAGGCIIALACDTRIIHSKAVIGLNEAAFGLIAPPWTIEMMINVCGYRHAEKALTLGTLLKAQDALAIGLVDQILDDCINEVAMDSLIKTWVPIPGRATTKAVLRNRLLSKYTTEIGREEDINTFVSLANKPSIQIMLGEYLQSLANNKAK